VLSINNKYIEMKKYYKHKSREEGKGMTQTLYTFSPEMDNYYEH